MEFTGLGLAQLAALFAAATAVVVALYLLRLRRVDVEVPNVELFEAVLSERRTTAWLSRRTRWLSLLFALCIVALLIFALGDPRAAARHEASRTLVVLVDVSASMQATDVSPTRLDRARDEAKRLVRTLGPDDRMMVVAVGATPAPVSPLTDDIAVLDDAIGALTPADIEDDLPRAMRFASDVLRDKSRPEIVWISDHAGTDALTVTRGIRTSHVRVGRASDNVGLAAFAVRRYPLDRSQAELLVEVENPTNTPRRVELTVYGDDRAIDVQELDVAAGDRTQRFLAYVSGANERLEARIRPVDGKADFLPADDHAFARIPERTKTKVLVVARDNLYLDAALLLDEYLEVTHISPEAYVTADAHDVVIFDGVTPNAAPTRPAIYLNPVPGTGFAPFAARGTVDGPRFERLERRDPLLRFTALADVNVARALVLETEQGDRVLGADRRAPLLVVGTRVGQPFMALAFDVRESDLPLRIAWPLLLLHAIEGFTEGPLGLASGISTGHVERVRVTTARERVTLTAPNGTRGFVPVVEGYAVIRADHAGFYALTTENARTVFAASLFSPRESRIAPERASTATVTRWQTPSRGRAVRGRAPWTLMVLAAMALLALEWLTFHRRWTV